MFFSDISVQIDDFKGDLKCPSSRNVPKDRKSPEAMATVDLGRGYFNLHRGQDLRCMKVLHTFIQRLLLLQLTNAVFVAA